MDDPSQLFVEMIVSIFVGWSMYFLQSGAKNADPLLGMQHLIVGCFATGMKILCGASELQMTNHKFTDFQIYSFEKIPTLNLEKKKLCSLDIMFSLNS